MSGAFDQLSKGIAASGSKAGAPNVRTLREFLTTQAMVKTPGGQYVNWSFEGRECLSHIVSVFDLVLGSETGTPLPDATIDLCGGAQFGKTVLALNIGVFLTGCRWYNWGYYLPDDDLVEGIVDSKLRPDVIEQIDWLADLMSVGTFEDKRGKSVNRKGAVRVSDGKRKAFMMIRGMGKIPTSFSMDAVFEDEKDDIPEKRSKFLTGRMTASDLRLKSSIGTQRVHGRGQQRQWQDGSQGIFEFSVPGRMINLEENWPQVCRMAVDGEPKPSDPKLDNAAMFRDANGRTWEPDPAAFYYLADPESGERINRNQPHERHLRPERIRQRHWSWRISQLGIAAIDLRQVVSRWQAAVRDPESMVVFCCDVLALPRNTTQGISPEIIDRSRAAEAPFDMGLNVAAGARIFAGLDTGDRCWFTAREVFSAERKRVKWAERIALGDMVRRTAQLAVILDVAFLVIDARSAASEARNITWLLNGLTDARWPDVDPDKSVVSIGGVTWDGPREQWRGIRAAVCEFTLAPGQGVKWRCGVHVQDGQRMLYPIIRANRFDSIDRVVKEFLTPAEGVIRVAGGAVVNEPVLRMPRGGTGAPPAVEEVCRHFQVGSERDDKGDYVDKVENHYLLSAAYGSLAEQVGQGRARVASAVEMIPAMRPEFRRKGGMI